MACAAGMSRRSEAKTFPLLFLASLLILTYLLANSFLVQSLGLLLLALILSFVLQCALRRFRSIKKVSPKHKAIFITGCDSGFGNALCRRLHNLGFKVFAGCLFPDKDGAKELKESCSESLVIVPIDVTDDKQVACAVQFVNNNLDGRELWAVVNNAGIAACTEIEWCPLSFYRLCHDVNTLGAVRVTTAFLPMLRESEGRVVNVASLAGRFTYPGFSAYSMSKYASIAFSNALRREMTKWNISVCTIEPTLYRTPISAEAPLLARNKSFWDEAPEHIKMVYGDGYFEAFQKLIVKSVREARSDINEVVNDMVEAVTAIEPKARYVPAFAVQMRAAILQFLPETWQDDILIPRSQPTRRLLSTASYSFGRNPAPHLIRSSNGGAMSATATTASSNLTTEL